MIQTRAEATHEEPPLDTHNLNAFLCVARHASFSRAADELHLTQPAISKRVSLLEDDLGLTLFDRIGRQVSLTEHGRRLVPRARAILQLIESSRQEMIERSADVSGTLSLAISHHIGLHRLPPVLKAFARRHPAVSLDIQFTDSELAYGAVQSGEIELAVITLAPEPAAQVVATRIWADPLHFAVSPEHELQDQSSLTLEQLSHYPAILPNRSTYTGLIIADLFARLGYKLQIDMATNYMETLKSMASSGLGWTVVPATMLDQDLHSLPVVDAPPLSRDLGCIHHRSRHLSRAATAFMAIILEFAAPPTTD